MATFIPERTRVSGRDLHIKRALNALDDNYVVRFPVRPCGWAPDFFLQHPAAGWLAIKVSDTPFSGIDPVQLFPEDRAEFEQLLSEFQNCTARLALARCPLEKLLLMWCCSPEETRSLSATYLSRFGVRLVSKQKFMELGVKLLPRLLAPLDEQASHALLGHFFPEAEIHSDTVQRRLFHRDNAARLTRLFLDNQQEWASKLDIELPPEQTELATDFSVRLINGVTGSGKTLIALHRALLLAELYPQRQIVVLAHNSPIIADILHRLHRARGQIPESPQITTFFAWAARQWNRVFGTWPSMPPKWQVLELIRHFRKRCPELKPTDAELMDEFDFINGALVANEAEYLTANRTGQGFPLQPKERSQIWALYEEVTSALAREGSRMWSAVPRDLCLVEDHRALAKYAYVLIDEAQFFAPSWFQVVKHSIDQNGSLFLCADPKQGFLKSRLSWKSVGLDVVGRTKKLRRSYRTTRAILSAASEILAQSTRADPEDFLEPDFSGMDDGTRPIWISTNSPQDAVDRVANELGSIAAENPMLLSNVLVIHGDKIDKHALVREVGKRLGTDRIWWLNKKEHKKAPPGGYGRDYLRLAYIDTATGLEAAVVFLIGIDDLFWGAEERAVETEERARKLYMGMTRAAQQLILVSTEPLPSAIAQFFERRA